MASQERHGHVAAVDLEPPRNHLVWWSQPPRITSQVMKSAMKVPGPDHPITVEPNPRRVRVIFGGRVVADTRGALTLREAGYKPVQYIPRADIDMTLFERTDHA